MKVKKYDLFQILFNILFMLVVILYHHLKFTNIIEILQQLLLLELIIILLNSFFYIKKYRYSLPIIGMNITMLLFFLGQYYIYVLGEKKLYILYFARGNEKLLLDTLIYSIQFIITFNIGVIIGDKLIKSKNTKSEVRLKNKKIFLEILIILIIINTLISFYIIFHFLKGGYSGIRNIKYMEILTKELKYFFNFYLFVLCINKDLKINKYLKLYYIILSFSFFFLGSRSLAVGLLLSYLLYGYMIENRKIKLKFVLFLGAILTTIPVIANIRVGKDFDIKDLIKIPMLILNELGFTAVPTIVILRNVPEVKKFEYGKTLYDGIARILRLDKIGYQVSEYGSVLVNKLEDVTWGLGFSLVAEAYLNFGKYLFIFAIIVGIIYSFFLIVKDKNDEFNKLDIIISIQILYFSVRSDFAYTIIYLFYFVILFKIIIKILIKLLGGYQK